MPSPRFAPSARARALAAAVLLLAVAGCVDRAAEHRVRANAFLRGGDAAAALKECDDGLADKKGNVPLLMLRGKALFELDRLDDARVSYQASIAAAGNERARSLAEAYLGLAMIASRQKNWPEARKQFEALVGDNESDGTSHLNVAKACLEMHDLPCALQHAETARRLAEKVGKLPGGNEEPALFSLGTIYLAADKPKEAESTFQHICEAVPGAASCPYGLALVAAKNGDRPRALRELDDAVKRKLPNPDQIASEPGFQSLRDDPEFQRIAARARNP